MITISQALGRAADLPASCDNPQLDVSLLLCAVLNKPASFLRTWPERKLTAEQQQGFEALLARRVAGEPIAYILREQAFWTLTLEVSESTLIPRADTEVLVEAALTLPLPEHTRMVDLGTGTGAIALALASEKPSWDVWGCDRIDEAVALARRNAAKNQLTQVSFVAGSWFEPLTGVFDLIVSNPPYIDPDDQHLQQGDVRFEPRSALVAEDAGLADIRQIATQARAYLTAAGWLVFEHGYDQGAAVRDLLVQLGYQQVETRRDYAGQERITLGQKSV